MADRKISDLTALTTPAAGDYLPIIDISEPLAANKNKRITIEELLRGAPDGTTAAPSFAFESDGGNGFYLAGTDTIGASTNGVNRLTLSTSALTSTVPISATSFIPTSSTVPANGLYLPATNSVALSTNGTGRLFVDASGRIGAGTSNPSETLTLNSAAGASLGFEFGGTEIGTISNNNAALYVTAASGNLLSLGAGGSERLRITSAGLVGIGTSTPDTNLTVLGQGFNQAVIRGTAFGTSSQAVWISNITESLGTTIQSNASYSNSLQYNPTATASCGIHFGNGFLGFRVNAGLTSGTVFTPTERVRIDSSGRVGIGTTSPNASCRLSVSNGGAEGIELRPGTATAGEGDILFYNRSTTSYLQANYLANIHTWSGPSGERARIDSSGRLLVGTSTARTNFLGGARGSLFLQEGDSSGDNRFSAHVHAQANGNGPMQILAKHRGTKGGTPSIVSNDDQLGIISFQGGDGTNFIQGAQITAQVDGTPGANDMPGRLVFSTTADGSASPTERLRIDSSGRVGIGASAPATLLEVRSATTNAARLRVTGTGTTAGNFRGYEFGNGSVFKGGLLQDESTDLISIFTPVGGQSVNITSAGSVGIGTTSPSAAADIRVASAGASILRLTDTANNQDLLCTMDVNKTIFFTGGSSTSAFAFVGGNAGERARIDSSGRLLVGTSTSPSAGNGQYARIVVQGYTGSAAGGAYISLQRGEAATAITAEDEIAVINFGDSAGNTFAGIACRADATAGAGDYPGRLTFSVTADGAASPTEALRISSNRAITVSDGGNVVLGTTTGTKIGTATTQKLGFYNATPVVQPTAVADATDAATVITQLNDLLAKLRTLGIIAT